jgi:hypothetical protein
MNDYIILYYDNNRNDNDNDKQHAPTPPRFLSSHCLSGPLRHLVFQNKEIQYRRYKNIIVGKDRWRSLHKLTPGSGILRSKMF